MFCPKCGADGQTADSYCKRCGQWLPDLTAIRRPGLFRKQTRDEKIRKSHHAVSLLPRSSFFSRSTWQPMVGQ